MTDRIFVSFAENGHIRKWSRQPFEIDGVRATEMVAAGAPGDVERLRTALEQICIHSNEDWSEVRRNPTSKLRNVHAIAVDAYYARGAGE